MTKLIPLTLLFIQHNAKLYVGQKAQNILSIINIMSARKSWSDNIVDRLLTVNHKWVNDPLKSCGNFVCMYSVLKEGPIFSINFLKRVHDIQHGSDY